MGTVAEAAKALEDALKTVDGLRVYRDRGAAIDPPAAIVNLPQLGWAGFCGSAPNSARFRIDLVVRANERANENLWDLIPQVAAAVETVPEATLAPFEFAATGVAFTTSKETQLPGYEITVDVPL